MGGYFHHPMLLHRCQRYIFRIKIIAWILDAEGHYQGIDPRNSGSRLMVAPFSQGYKWRDLKHISRAVDFTAALWGNTCFRGTGEKWSVNNYKVFHFHCGPEQMLRLYKLCPEKWDLHTVETAGVITGLLAHSLSVPLDHGAAAVWESFHWQGQSSARQVHASCWNMWRDNPPAVRVRVKLPEEREGVCSAWEHG